MPIENDFHGHCQEKEAEKHRLPYGNRQSSSNDSLAATCRSNVTWSVEIYRGLAKLAKWKIQFLLQRRKFFESCLFQSFYLHNWQFSNSKGVDLLSWVAWIWMRMTLITTADRVFVSVTTLFWRNFYHVIARQNFSLCKSQLCDMCDTRLCSDTKQIIDANKRP